MGAPVTRRRRGAWRVLANASIALVCTVAAMALAPAAGAAPAGGTRHANAVGQLRASLRAKKTKKTKKKVAATRGSLGTVDYAEIVLLALLPFVSVLFLLIETDRRRRSRAPPASNLGSGASDIASRPTPKALTKVPEVTALFWITKVLTTGMGESTSDYLVHRFVPVVAAIPVGIVFVGALLLQLAAPEYVAWTYWFAVAMVSVFGTMAADVVHVELGVPYLASSAFFLAVLAAIFAIWNASEKTLSVHSIYTRRRELFYWATVLTTFALGTAVGDLTAVTFNLGYFSSGVLFAVLIAIPAVAYWRFRINAIFAFWFAYVLTRPLGASFADWMGVSRVRGGLAWGTGPVSVVLAIVIALLVGYLSIRRESVDGEALA